MITACDRDTLYGLSTDQMPENVPNGQKLVLMDTGVEKIYDEENDEWRSQE